MQKTYINPNIEVIDIDMKSAMLTSTSGMSVGDSWKGGEGGVAGRGNDGDDW